MVDELNLVAREESLQAVGLRMHEADEDLAGRGLADDAKVRAVDVDRVVVRAGRSVTVSTRIRPLQPEKCSMSAQAQVVRPEPGRGARSHVIVGDVLAELVHDAHAAQGIECASS